MKPYCLTLLSALILLTSCMSYAPQKSPCDQNGTGCGQKIKINQW